MKKKVQAGITVKEYDNEQYMLVINKNGTESTRYSNSQMELVLEAIEAVRNGADCELWELKVQYE